MDGWRVSVPAGPAAASVGAHPSMLALEPRQPAVVEPNHTP